jgi:hypothetical protein
MIEIFFFLLLLLEIGTICFLFLLLLFLSTWGISSSTNWAQLFWLLFELFM